MALRKVCALSSPFTWTRMVCIRFRFPAEGKSVGVTGNGRGYHWRLVMKEAILKGQSRVMEFAHLPPSSCVPTVNTFSEHCSFEAHLIRHEICYLHSPEGVLGVPVKIRRHTWHLSFLSRMCAHDHNGESWNEDALVFSSLWSVHLDDGDSTIV